MDLSEKTRSKIISINEPQQNKLNRFKQALDVTHLNAKDDEDGQNTCFKIIRSNETQQQKINALDKALKGADINARYNEDRNNTLLHIAVQNGEELIVRFFLEKEASATIKNDDNLTSIDFAQRSDAPNKYFITQWLKGNIYKKRDETAGIEGQLYETRLMTLIYIRAVLNKNVTRFSVRTSLDQIDALDDIIFKYKCKGMNEDKLIFLQAKHRVYPTKGMVMIDELLKDSGDFSLPKYFESYLKIMNTFSSENVKYELVIYTPAKDNLKEEYKTSVLPDKFIVSNKSGNIFKFKYENEHVHKILMSVAKSRSITLAQRLAHMKDNYQNIMSDEWIKTYQVFLEQYIFELSYTKNELYVTGKFRPSFLTSQDVILVAMRNEVFKRLKIDKAVEKAVTNSIKSDSDKQKENIDLPTFKFPKKFGIIDFNFHGDVEKEMQCRRKLIQLRKNGTPYISKSGTSYIFVDITESVIGPKNILQHSDLDSDGLAGLLGKLLVYDIETKMLKFNLNNKNMSTDLKRVFEQLEKDRNFKNYRFNVGINCFNKFYFINENDDRKLVEDFLGKLTFYTNQVQEHEVWDVFKNKFKEFAKNKCREYDTNFQDKYDFIFPIVHEKIQSWWKLHGKAFDIDENCPFYCDAENKILGSTLLDCLHYTAKENIINNTIVKFKKESVNLQVVHDFFISSQKLLIISSTDIQFSCVKLQQNIDKNNFQHCRYIDLDILCTAKYFSALKTDFGKSKINFLVLISRETVSKILAEKINNIKEIYKGKLVTVTSACTLNDMKTKFSDAVFLESDEICFKDLDISDSVLAERLAVFQNNEMPINRLVDNESLNFLTPKQFRDILDNKQKLVISETLETNNKNIGDQYRRRRLFRCITLNSNTEHYDKLLICNDYESEILIGDEQKDIVLISDSNKTFETVCNENQSRNIHWFKRVESQNVIVWEKSHGNIDGLIQYVDRDKAGTNLSTGDISLNLLQTQYEVNINDLNDLSDKTVVISSDAGMGKSTLLNYLLENVPKEQETDHWILKLDLSNRIILDQMSKWKDNNIEIVLLEAFKLLYMALDVFYYNCTENIDILNVDIFDEIIKAMYINDDKFIHIVNKKKLERYNKINVFKINLFNTFYNSKKVVLLFDSLDEILFDYEKQVLQLMKTLKQSNIGRLWVATRPYNTLNRLECALGTFCHNLQPFDIDEQQLYLYKKWVPYDKYDNIDIYLNLTFWYSLIASSLDSYQNQFTAYPLHLQMISDIYIDLFRSCVINNSGDMGAVMKISNLASLYKKFVEKKIEIELKVNQEKHRRGKLSVKKLRKWFLSIHKKVSVYYLFPKHIVKEILSVEDIDEIQDFINDLKLKEENNGIVYVTVDNQIKFVHLAFAEYFAAEFICEKIKSQTWSSLVWNYLLNTTFDTLKKGIYEYVESILSFDENKLINLFEPNYPQRAFKHLLLVAHNKIGDTLIGLLLEQCTNIILLILKCINTVLDKSNINVFITMIRKKRSEFCIMCRAVKSQNFRAVSYIIKMIKYVDEEKLKSIFLCQDLPESHPFAVLFYYCKEDVPQKFNLILRELVNHNEGDLLVELIALSKGVISSSDNNYVDHNYFSAKMPFIKDCIKKARKLDQIQREKLLFKLQKMYET